MIIPYPELVESVWVALERWPQLGPGQLRHSHDSFSSLVEQLERRDGLLLQCASVLQATYPQMAERLREVVAESSAATGAEITSSSSDEDGPEGNERRPAPVAAKKHDPRLESLDLSEVAAAIHERNAQNQEKGCDGD